MSGTFSGAPIEQPDLPYYDPVQRLWDAAETVDMEDLETEYPDGWCPRCSGGGV